MSNPDIGMITFSIGLIGSTAIEVFSTIYHKKKKYNSFKFLQVDDSIVITKNKMTTALKSISYFFALTMITFFVAEIKESPNLLGILSGVYALCFLLAYLEFRKRTMFKIIINKRL